MVVCTKRTTMNKLILLLSVAILIIITGCEKRCTETWMYYDETICPPGWVDPDNNSNTKQWLEGYLRGHEVVPIKIRITGNYLPNTCGYCDCPTGRTFKVRIDKMYISKMEWLGFRR